MKPPRALAIITACCLSLGSTYAGQFGSETRVTLTGSVLLTEADSSKTLKGGKTRTTKTRSRKALNNATVLGMMEERGLIPTTAGYAVVMVGHTHIADGINFFAIAEGSDPVAIPGDILHLAVNDGPGEGRVVETSEGLRTRLNIETSNYAILSVGAFSGGGILDQKWRSKIVTKKHVDHSVDLVDARGSFSGIVSSNPENGVGIVDLTLTGARTVNLKRYGMATADANTSGGSFGSVGVSGGTLELSLSDISVIDGGSLSVTGNNVGTGALTLADGSVLLGSDSPIPGLSFAFDGTVVSPFILSTSQPNELSLNTTDGPIVFTRESGDVWTPVVPEP